MHGLYSSFFRLARKSGTLAFLCAAVLPLLSWIFPNVTASCLSAGVDMIYPLASKGVAGWTSLWKGEKLQGHVAGGLSAWGKDVLVVFGGTSTRNDDVNDVLGETRDVVLYNRSSAEGGISDRGDWTTLDMIAYDGSPSPLFRAASFVWNTSLFVVGGHTDVDFEVTADVWRADIHAFEGITREGMWRQVNVTTANDSLGVDILPQGRYGHTATVLDTSNGSSNSTERVIPSEVWVIVLGGMDGYQTLVEDNHILLLKDTTGDTIQCAASALPLGSQTCSDLQPTRPLDTTGEWWSLEQRLASDSTSSSTSSSSAPPPRAYHTAASLPSDGLGNTSCLYVFGGWDYLNSILYGDLWRLCPVAGWLGSSNTTRFRWTELNPAGSSPLARYGAVLLSGVADATHRLLLFGGTGRYPYSYMGSENAHEYDARIDVWLEADFGGVPGLSAPGGRRDCTLSVVEDGVLMAYGGVDNTDVPLADLWVTNFSSPICPSGRYTFLCPDDGTVMCASCPNGTFSEAGSYTCSSCPSGAYASPEGSPSCTPCAAGKYGTGPSGVSEGTGCRECPAGTSSAVVGLPSEDGCLACSAGMYSSSGAVECLPCPSGSYSMANASSCSSCEAGTYSLSTSSGTCLPCMAGTYAPFSQAETCLDCPRGHYSNSQAMACFPCPVGTAGASVAGGDEAEACLDCPKGSYSDTTGESACELCPSGSASEIAGASNSSVCKVCSAGSYSLPGAGSCDPCPVGHFASGEGSDACDPCPENTYLDITGGTSQSQCISCTQGQYTSGKSGSGSSADCLPCPPGTHSISMGDGGGCQVCPRGEYTSTYAQAQSLNCTECGGGFFTNSTGSSSCTACNSSSFSYRGHPQCVGCNFNNTCPLGPDGSVCSGHGTCDLGLCDCDNEFSGVDCSNGTCALCPGVFGFSFLSTSATASGMEESVGVVNLTLVRLVGTEGEAVVTVSTTGGNALLGRDYNGSWPMQVTFASGQTEAGLSFPLLDDKDPDEDCVTILLNITEISAGGVRTAVGGGIHDVEPIVSVRIVEDDFTSTVLSTVPVDDEGGGRVSPVSAQVFLSDIAETYYSNVSLLMSASTASNTSLAPGLDILLAVEANASMSSHLSRLSKLLPGLVAQVQSKYASPRFGVASFSTKPSPPVGIGAGSMGSFEYNLSLALTDNADDMRSSLETVTWALKPLIPPGGGGSQLTALFMAAKRYNETGWRDSTFRLVAVLTGSSFDDAESSTSNDLDSSSDPLENYITVSDLGSQLSSSAVHPLFLLTNSDATLVKEYKDLVEELGFGAVVVVDQEAASESSFNKDYLPSALIEGLEKLYTQGTFFITSDPENFVSSVSPTNDPFRNVTAGTTLDFLVNISAASASAGGDGGDIGVSFQGHEALLTVVHRRETCATAELERGGGSDMNELDASRVGWLQGFYADESTEWIYSSLSSFVEVQGPFGVTLRALNISCPGGCSGEEAFMKVSLGYASEMPLVLKAYSKADIIGFDNDRQASLTLTVTYEDGTTEDGILLLDLETGTDQWEQSFGVLYPTEIVSEATVIISFSGTGGALFASVGLFAHPTAACRCDARYFLDIESAPAKLCSPQPSCRFFKGDCNYCRAGYKCPQGGVLTSCMDENDGESQYYSMGGSTECSTCPDGWICDRGLAVPCGYGKGATSSTTNVGGSDAQFCESCPPGGACPGGGVYETCPPGKYSPGGSAALQCIDCHPGMFTNSTASEECKKCPAGYTSNHGSSACEACPAGEFSSEGQHPCATCRQGSFSEGGASNCTACAIGTYSNNPSMSYCVACPGSTTTLNEGATSIDECV